MTNKIRGKASCELRFICLHIVGLECLALGKKKRKKKKQTELVHLSHKAFFYN